MRLIDQDGKQLGVCSVPQALTAARERGLDLVEVAPQASPPVCRIMDYGKYLYKLAKREKSARRMQKTIETKEVRLGPRIAEHDLQILVKRAHSFLSEGCKVRLRVRFRGREVMYSQLAQVLLVRMAQELADVASIESQPEMDAGSLLMVLGPGRRK